MVLVYKLDALSAWLLASITYENKVRRQIDTLQSIACLNDELICNLSFVLLHAISLCWNTLCYCSPVEPRRPTSETGSSKFTLT